VACDSYNLYNRDVEMLSELGVDFYRFSLSWSRILPDGFSDNVNVDGVTYYNNLIDALLGKGIQPLITLYHWDLPQKMQELGGWPNPLLANYFEDYAKVAFDQFGDRVKHWITFNEPKNFCLEGYGRGSAAPGLNVSGVGEYMCAHTILQAHAKAYHLYDKKYRSDQKGKPTYYIEFRVNTEWITFSGSVGITLDVGWVEPATSSKKDEEAAERALQFSVFK
jgi:beta-glucosidase/6-phospho-beta-glucosidase/beta-galactosidase